MSSIDTDFEHEEAVTGEDSDELEETSALDQELANFVRRAGGGNLASVPAYKAFKSQIDRYPLLSPEAQDELFQKIVAGREAQAELEEAQSRKDMVRIRKLRQLMREGEEAVEYLVGSNLRLVLVIAGELASQRLGDQAFSALPDLVQEGNIGLMEAVRVFDPSKEVPFHTYAAKRIREKVRDSLVSDREVRVPASWARVARIAAGVSSRLHAELGREPTIDEVRDEAYIYCMEWAYERVKPEFDGDPEEGAKAVLKKAGILAALRNLEKVLQITSGGIRLDAPLGDEEDSGTIGDLYASTDDHSAAFDEAERSELREALMLALGGLTEREREIILLRYGFVDDERWTYAMLGEKYGVTAERIRQIENKVLSRLTSPTAQYVHLSSFLDTQIDAAIDEYQNRPVRNAADAMRRRQPGPNTEQTPGGSAPAPRQRR